MVTLENKIHFLRGMKVMLDTDLAEIYGVDVKRLNEQVKRNRDRFPEDFVFQLTDIEYASILKSQIATSSEETILRSQNATLRFEHGKHRKFLPYAFTEHGAVMLATILRSPTAIKASILVVKAFVKLNEYLSLHKDLAEKMKLLESKSDKHDQEIQTLFQTIHELMATPPPPELPPMKKVGFKRKDEISE